MTEVGSAFVSIVPSAKGFGKKLDSDIGPDLDKSGKAGGKRFGSSMGGSIGRTLKSALSPALAVLGTAGLIAGVKDAIGEAREAQKVGALTNAVIKSTGGVAKVSAKDVDRLSTALSNKIGVDDEAIAAGQNMLLTFSRVRNEVGRGNDIFNQATVAANDMAAAFGGDAVSNSKLLGKALNDPIKGVSALTKVGVSFTQGQKDQIKSLVASNDLLGAQRIILGEVTKQTKGAAVATATSGEKTRVAFANLQETIGTALLPVIDKLSVKLTKDIIPAVSEFVGEMQDGTGAGGKVADILGDIYDTGKSVATIIGKVVTTFDALPGSTQKVLLLAGAALLLKNHFAGSIPSMQSFNREATVAAAKSAAIRGGALAGSAGLLALASSAGGASTDVGTLATVGAGVAAGFAVGGPWGAAIGGGAGLLSVFASRSSSAAAAQREFDTAGKAVAATLNQQTGALSAATRATAAKQLADTGAFTAASKIGVAYRDVLDAALGNEAAMKRVDAATKAYVISQNTSQSSMLAAARTASKLGSSVHSTTNEIEAERKKIGQVNAAMNSLDGVTATVKVTANTSGFFDGIGSVFSALDRAIQKAAKVKVGKNAKGTDNWRGGLTWVGEEGPELINLAKGAQVIPNHKISAGVTGSSIASSSPLGDMPIVDGSQIIGYLRGIATGQARIEIGALTNDAQQYARMATL